MPVRSSTCHAAPIPALDARITHPVLATSSSRIAEARNYDISSNIFNRDINPIESTQMYDPQLLSSQLRDASQSTLQQETTPLQSSAQYTDVDNTINRYIRHALLNNVPTPRSNVEDSQILSLQLQNISRLMNLPQLNDTDASRRSVLHQLHNTVNQSVTDPFILSLLSSTASPSLPHQEPTMLSRFPSERGNAFMNLASLPSLSGIDPSVLLLILAAQNGVERNHVHQSHSGPSILPQLQLLEQLQFRASVGSHNRTFLTSITAAVQPQQHTSFGSFPNHPALSNSVAAIRDILQQQNDLNHHLPDEQTIRDAILLVQEQLSSATDNA